VRRSIVALALAAALASSTARAQEAIIAPVERGQASPIAGVVFSPPAVAKVIADRDEQEAAARLAVQHQAEVDAADAKRRIDSLLTTHSADLAVMQAQLADAQRQVNVLLQQKQPAASSNPTLWVMGGAAAGVVLYIVARFVVTTVAK